MEEKKIQTFEWSVPEYFYREHTNDWYWTIGLITLISFVFAIWKNNFIFSIFIFISGACVIIFSIKKPQILDVTIDDKGIRMSRTFFGWNEIKSFNIIDTESEEFSKLVLDTTKKILPIYAVFIPKEIADDVEIEIKKVSTKSNIEEPKSVQFADKIGL